jgi:hypothetical protein
MDRLCSTAARRGCRKGAAALANGEPKGALGLPGASGFPEAPLDAGSLHGRRAPVERNGTEGGVLTQGGAGAE